MHRSQVRRSLTIGCLLLTFVGCSNGSSTEERVSAMKERADAAIAQSTVPTVDPWDGLRIYGDEVEGYPDFTSMREAADATLVVRFTDFRVGRTMQGDAEENPVRHIDAHAEVVQVVTGPAASSVVIEFLSGAVDEEAYQQDVAALQSVVNGSEAVVFLRNKTGSGEEKRLRLVNSYGLVSTDERSLVVTPLGEKREGLNGEIHNPSDRWPTLDAFIADLT